MYNQGAAAYRMTSITTTDPARLIMLLYEGALKNLFLAREGVVKNDPVKRGEHLGKAISIITELLASVEGDPENEVVQFLRGLYSSMLKELMKVNISNDVKPIELSIKYLAQLKNIWKEQVLEGEGRKALDDIQHKAEGNLSLGRRHTVGGYHAKNVGADTPQGFYDRG